MTLPLVDLRAQEESIRPELEAAALKVLRSGLYINGEEVRSFEQEFAASIGARHAIGVASCTDALTLSLLALGIGPGDEVIVPTFTFVATASAVIRIGAVPVFCDSNPDTFCIDPESVAARITSRTKAVIPVHLFGHPADMGALQQICGERGIHLLEDAAQAYGSSLHGQPVGTIGTVGCFSFFPTKPIGGYGDGGMIVTQNAEIAETIRMLARHGCTQKYRPKRAGFNSRLDELQAALLRVKLPHVSAWNNRRRALAALYREALTGLPLHCPVEKPDRHHVYHLFVVRIPGGLRDTVQSALAQEGIASGIHYPVPLHRTEAFESFARKNQSFPIADQLCAEVLALPLYPEMSDADGTRVATCIRTALR